MTIRLFNPTKDATTVIKNGLEIKIDTFHNIITVNAPGNVMPCVKLSHNKSHVLKFNKNSVSTCNVEMLTHMLKNNYSDFMSIYTFIKYRNLHSCKELNNTSCTTKAAFYNSFNDNIGAFIQFFKDCSNETRQQIIYDHICFNHEAKMNGIISLSTYVGYNKYCLARCNNCNNAICKYCYAASLTDMRQGLKNKLIRIHAIFTCVELTKNDIPIINPAAFPYFRFESFGDINNTIQVNNYNLFAAVNPGVNFTLWTKNPGIVQAAINQGMIISNNLIIGLSSLYLNTPEIDKAKKYTFIRFLFTVYDDQFIQDHDIKINCGARHCITCGVCYKALHEHKNGDLYIINERKK